MFSSPPRLVVLAILGFSQVWPAQAMDTPPAAAGAKPPETRQTAQPPGAAFQVPEGDVAALIAFVVRLRKEKTPDGDYPKKIAAIVSAGSRLEALAGEADRQRAGYDEAIGIWLYTAVYETETRKEQDELIRAAKQHVASSAAISKLAIGALKVMIERFAETPQRVTSLSEEFEEALAASSDPQALRYAQNIQGTARRLTLVGQPVRIFGTKMDGRPLDADALRGKVVLVDFWATWCKPCIVEVPNIRRHYDLYHDRGFEVVGISLDDDRQKLEAYLAENDYPWPTLHDPIETADHMARYYGITAIPTLILVDQNGKAVTVNAAGPALGEKLAELLGPAEAEAEKNQ
jgi:thiol-disulfide isomerase/thioredoxin